MSEIVIPAFLMDCQDWIVLQPEQAGLSDELNDAPVLLALSTAVVEGDELQTASGVLCVGLLDGPPLPTRALGGDCIAAELIDEPAAGIVRYVVPVPHGGAALVAEFTVAPVASYCLHERIEALMRSFRWAPEADQYC